MSSAPTTACMDIEGATGLGLFRVRPDATGLTRVTPATGARFDYGRTSWSPDGERIVTQVEGDGGLRDHPRPR